MWGFFFFFFHVCLGYTTFCKYLIGLRDSRSFMLSVHAFGGAGREAGPRILPRLKLAILCAFWHFYRKLMLYSGT